MCYFYTSLNIYTGWTNKNYYFKYVRNYGNKDNKFDLLPKTIIHITNLDSKIFYTEEMALTTRITKLFIIVLNVNYVYLFLK